MMTQIKIVLVEDHTIVRKGVRALLEYEEDFEVLAEASDGREAVKKVEQFHPDVVLMDISMPRLNGLEATRQIKQRYPETSVLVLSMYETKEYIFQFLQAGASGYLVKHSAPKELIWAIRTVYQGNTYLSSSISKVVIEEYIQSAEKTIKNNHINTLTNREREVLQLIVEGNPSSQIAAILHISEKTVRTHRSNIMKKLEIHSIAELTQYAISKGII
ncbi:MAG: response regulator transcription factor [Anaerolineaceae bacterium]|nr:response regulator transcription factor [Anaerolineaceae bacterium]